VFTIIYLKQTVFLGYIVLQLLCNYNLCYFPCSMLCTFTFWSMCAVPNRPVFCSSLNSCFSSILLRYFLNDYEMVAAALVNTVITFVCTFQIPFVSVVGPCMFLNILSYFPSPEIATYINKHVPFSLSSIMMSSLLLGRVLWLSTCWFPDMVTLPLWLVYTDFGKYSFQCSLSNFIPISLHTIKCSWAYTVSFLCM